MVNTGRRYEDPSPETVIGAAMEGVNDPTLLVEDSWTPEQKRRWIAQFNVYAKAARAKQGEAADATFEQDVKALGAAQEHIPVVSEIGRGVSQGLKRIASLGHRAYSLASPPEFQQESLADVGNRQADEQAAIYALGDTRTPGLSTLQRGLRGATESVTQAAVLGPLGPGGVVAGFAASEGSQAYTEGKDAGLTGSALRRHVGRSALIEGGVAAAFQLVGAGLARSKIGQSFFGAGLAGTEGFVGGGLRDATTKQLLANALAELTEENATEFLHAFNRAEAGLTPDVTDEQLWEIFKDTSVQTALTLGLSRGVGKVESLLRRPEVLVGWAFQNPEAARELLASPDPSSRTSWKKAGLPNAPGPVRDEAVTAIQGAMQEFDAPPATGLSLPPAVEAATAPPPIPQATQVPSPARGPQARTISQIQREDGVGFGEAVRRHQAELDLQAGNEPETPAPTEVAPTPPPTPSTVAAEPVAKPPAPTTPAPAAPPATPPKKGKKPKPPKPPVEGPDRITPIDTRKIRQGKYVTPDEDVKPKPVETDASFDFGENVKKPARAALREDLNEISPDDEALMEGRDIQALRAAGQGLSEVQRKALRAVSRVVSKDETFSRKQIDKEAGSAAGRDFGNNLAAFLKKGYVQEAGVETKTKNGRVYKTQLYKVTEEGRLAELGSRLSLQEEQGEVNVEAEIERGIAQRRFAVEAPARPQSPGTKAAKPGSPVNAVEVTKKAEELYPGLLVRGRGTAREFTNKQVRGFFDEALGEIRQRERYDVVNLAHEVGHFYDREIKKSGDATNSPEIQAELEQLGHDLYSDPEKPPAGGDYKAEGFAEFTREYLRGAEDLESRAPNLYEWWTTEYLPAHPKDAKRVEELGQYVRRFLYQSSEEKLKAFMSPPKEDWSLKRLWARWFGEESRFEKNWLNRLAPLFRAEQKSGADLSKLKPSERPFFLASVFQGQAGARAAEAVLRKVTDIYERPVAGSKSLKEIIEPLYEKGVENVERWEEYHVSRVAQERKRVNPDWNPGLPMEVFDEIVEERKNEPGFEKASKEFTDLADHMLDLLVDAGAITTDEKAAMREANPIYAPWLRRIELEANRPGTGRGGGSEGVFHTTKEGNNLPIHRPIEAMIAHIAQVYKVAQRQAVLQSAVRFYDLHKKGEAPYLAQFLSEEPVPTESVTFDAGQIRAFLLKKARGNDEAGAAVEEHLQGIDEALQGLWLDDNITIHKPGKLPKDRRLVISVVVPTTTTKDGETVTTKKRRNFEVQPQMYELLAGLNPQPYLPETLGAVGKVIRGATGLQRLGATGLNLSFGLARNALRDTTSAAINSDYHFHIPIISTLRGLAEEVLSEKSALRAVFSSGPLAPDRLLGHYLGISPDRSWARDYEASVLNRAGYVGHDIDTARQARAQLGPGLLKTAKKRGVRAALKEEARTLKQRGVVGSVQAGLDGVREFFSLFESAPRIMENQAARKEGLRRWGNDWEGQKEANLLAHAAAADITLNFPAGGEVSKKINEAVPFFNAGILGLEKMARQLGLRDAMPWQSTQDRKKMAAKTLARGGLWLTSLALALYALSNRDDDEWKNLPPYEKWGYLHFPLPQGGYARIPLPYESGGVFASLPIAFLESLREGKDDAFFEALSVVVKGASPVPDPTDWHDVMRTVALFGPIADVVANKDWKGAPIIQRGLEDNRIPSDQFGPHTLSFSRYLGEVFPNGGVSPAKLEHVLNGYSGGLYRRIGSLLEMLKDPSGVQPLKDPSTLPVLGTLFLRPGTSRAVGDFYDRLKWLRQRHGSGVATLEEEGELAEAERTNKRLRDVWKKRTDAIKSDASAASVKEQTEALAKEAEELIGAHNRRETKSDRQVGLGTILHRMTDPSAEPKPLPKDVTRDEALEALHFEALRRAAEARASEKKRGHKVKPLANYVRVRDDQGDLTAFGKRRQRLLKALRGE